MRKDLPKSTATSQTRHSTLKDMTSSLNMSKLFNYPTQGNCENSYTSSQNLETISPENVHLGPEQKDSMFEVSAFLGTPRKTAYFGK